MGTSNYQGISSSEQRTLAAVPAGRQECAVSQRPVLGGGRQTWEHGCHGLDQGCALKYLNTIIETPLALLFIVTFITFCNWLEIWDMRTADICISNYTYYLTKQTFRWSQCNHDWKKIRIAQNNDLSLI